MTVLSWILVALLVASMVITAIVCIDNKKLKESNRALELNKTELHCDYDSVVEELRRLTDRIVVLHDKRPKSKKANASALQLSNEIIPYIVEEGDQITITVLK